MSLLTKDLSAGSINGVIYDFEKTGDLLPMHTHDENSVHITIVARGSIKVSGHGWERIAKSGAILDFKPHQPHEFIALEDNTRLVNITKHSPD
jgi:quercetin dioxygenase-like cupin family protein